MQAASFEKRALQDYQKTKRKTDGNLEIRPSGHRNRNPHHKHILLECTSHRGTNAVRSNNLLELVDVICASARCIEAK